MGGGPDQHAKPKSHQRSVRRSDDNAVYPRHPCVHHLREHSRSMGLPRCLHPGVPRLVTDDWLHGQT